MKIKPIEELEIGDKIVIQTGHDTVEVQTIKELLDDAGMFITEESYPMEITVDWFYIPVLDDDF